MIAQRLLLIDALNLIYRAFYAIAGLSTSAGRPTNAIYGFIKTLALLERIWQPAYWLVVFDGGLPPERLALHPSYKAQRPPMPAALHAQIRPLEDYLDAARIPRLRLDGKEADDLLASAAVRGAAANCEVLVVSSDKDLMQIVSERVALLAPGKASEKIGPAQVQRRTGVRPDQIVDWLAMIGDNADNIPGVPGVGAKTAARWLNQWGSWTNIWQHLKELKPDKLRAALSEHEESVLRNINLIRLQQDLECFAALESLRRQPADRPRLQALFQELEFYSLANKLNESTLL